MIARAEATNGTPFYVVSIGQTTFQVGPYHTNWKSRPDSAFLSGVEHVFGKPDTCTSRGDIAWARWPTLGLDVVAELDVPGGKAFTRSGGGCAEPMKVVASYFTLSGRWQTDRGLRIGDSESRLHHLYPQAKRHANGVWLHQRQAAWGEIGDLRAVVTKGTVTAFAFVSVTSD